jgi:hypothetical protein
MSNPNAKEIGYMTYNKLNVFMSVLLVSFSISYAALGERTSIAPNEFLIGTVVLVAMLFSMLFSMSSLTQINEYILYNIGTKINNIINFIYTYQQIVSLLLIAVIIIVIIILATVVSPWWALSFALMAILVLSYVIYKNPIITAAIISILSIVAYILFLYL